MLFDAGETIRKARERADRESTEELEGGSIARRLRPRQHPTTHECHAREQRHTALDDAAQRPDHRSVYVQMVRHNAQTTGQSLSRWSGTTPRPQVSLCPDGQAQRLDHRSVYVQMVRHNAQMTGQPMSRWSVTMLRPQVSLCPDGQSQCPDHSSVYVQMVRYRLTCGLSIVTDHLDID